MVGNVGACFEDGDARPIDELIGKVALQYLLLMQRTSLEDRHLYSYHCATPSTDTEEGRKVEEQ